MKDIDTSCPAPLRFLVKSLVYNVVFSAEEEKISVLVGRDPKFVFVCDCFIEGKSPRARRQSIKDAVKAVHDQLLKDISEVM